MQLNLSNRNVQLVQQNRAQQWLNILNFKNYGLDLNKEQKELCERYNAPFVETPSFLKVGISLNVKDGIQPINGLRHALEGDTSGWYIWAGENLPDDPDFFVPLHIGHLLEWCPDIIKYLGLPPGWRFLNAPDYEDVWEDKTLLTYKEE
jgi:hypothetical protein